MKTHDNPFGAFLANRFGDRYLHAVNRNAFNATGSDALYRSTFGDAIFAPYQLHVVVGTDSGIFPRFVARYGIPAGSRYLFIELPEVLAVLEQERVLEGLPEEIAVTTVENWREKAREMNFDQYIFLDAVFLQNSIASSDAHLPEYRELSWTLSLELNTTLHQVHAAINCKQFILRQLENVADDRVCFAETLAGAFAGKTAIVLAGGPSLHDAIPWVRENRDRVVVIAVSRISRILLDQGIVPHIIATVDPQQVSFEVSREMLRFSTEGEGPVLVNSHHATPLLVGQWRGRSIFTSTLFPWSTRLNRDNLFYTGPTVGNYALSLAMNLGCRDIVLAGVDLCYTAKGQTHAAGSNENKVGPDLGRFSPRLETYDGGYADTNQGYLGALHVLATQAQLARAHGQRVYNCSLVAAKVELIDHISLEELTLPPAEMTPAQIMAQRVPPETPQSRLTHYRTVKKELSRVRSKYQEILNLSKEALQCADGLFGTDGTPRDFRHKIRMDKIERKLDRFGDLTLLVKQFGLKRFLGILKAPKEVDEWTDEQVEKATRDYYVNYLEGTEYLIELIDRTLQRVESRMEEEKERPDLERLFPQWEEDRQFGRVRIWKEKHGDRLELDPAQKEKSQELEREFERSLTEEHTQQMEILEQIHDVKHTRSKALLLYSRQKLDELEAMAQALSEHPNPEKALPYLQFVNGLVAQLRGEADQAFGCYQDLVQETSPLAEDALQQIASLALAAGDAESALLAMDCLAGLAPAYLPPYGDLLKAVGRFEDAFNSYNRYLGLVPDDVSAMIKLGTLCLEAGITDAAGELFQRVLAVDPNNSAAQTLLRGAAA